MIALLLGAGFALFFSLFATPLFIKIFQKIGWGQFIREDGPQSHHTKRGTPTMGGIVIISGAVLGYGFGHLVGFDLPSVSGLLALFMLCGMGLIGFIDDFAKARRQQSLGLGGWAKVLGQAIVATIFAILAINFPDSSGITPASMAISATRDIEWLNIAAIGGIAAVALFVLWVNIIAISASNGVNVADGLDGLASGSAIIAFVGYVIIAFWQFNQSCANIMLDPEVAYKCYDVRDSLDLAALAAAIAASTIGFLWWNTSPAQIFMGDTGSLALGGALAAFAVLTKTELLIVLIGSLFVIVAGSVIVQRVYFKLTGGKRIFLMSPLHHHFELKGWAEVTVVVRFWLIAALGVAVGVGLFYLDWVSR
ncbi:MAG: phospho-N-acetylmuramoyl-pentapeptide-transferase [Microbacteriaceae bacterium]